MDEEFPAWSARLAVPITHAWFILSGARSYPIACVSATLRMSSVQKERVAVYFLVCRERERPYRFLILYGQEWTGNPDTEGGIGLWLTLGFSCPQ